jgi:RNA polymerase sigma factor (TIGR02999 family)
MSSGQKNDDLLVAEVYAELRRIAATKVAAESPGLSLAATDLVHEVFLRLKRRASDANWANASHYLVAASEAMRRVLVDRARRRRSKKHGGGRLKPLPEDMAVMVQGQDPLDLIALDDALAQLEAAYPRVSTLVKLRYFAGLSIDAAAEVLGVSASTVDSDWAFARAWLKVAIDGRLVTEPHKFVIN